MNSIPVFNPAEKLGLDVNNMEGTNFQVWHPAGTSERRQQHTAYQIPDTTKHLLIHMNIQFVGGYL